VLHEVEQHKMARFVTNQDFGAFSVFVAANDVILEKVIPRISPLEAVSIIELNFLPLDGKEEEFT
jgi:hypothetical protein|tara:strand:+ start:192 stop:386 length:195 start_codon:yes stop_codon:yes gene_type:complete